MLELMILQQQQQGLKHGNGEHAVGQDRQQDMGQNARLLIDGLRRAAGGELGHQRGQGAQGQQ